ncbi:hypothetical protein C8A00DRAFT_44371 [Chaetomidium leptoderma]|uniref:Uncharacterized protein n=1 Tax=Chaetomidium leptoderma TaxID=669021 RepID=A0AAN6ZW94_9PEZI|nr:hypothetical protein C8A00DRAFT_44371 [Chaetomidium leptoderma]
MKFEFIDNSAAIDHVARRQIRSHVAKGRNVGRKLVRASRKRVLSRETNDQNSETTTAPSGPQTGTGISVLTLKTVTSLPAHWQQSAASGSLALVQKAASFLGGIRHARELDLALDYSSEPRTRWVQPMFVNEAYFHGAMAVFMAAFPSPSSSLTNGQSNSAARVRHLCTALRLVNDRLSGRDAVSNETIIVVLVLGLYERVQGEYGRGLVHLDGLQRMLNMRGGIQEFAKNRPELARKIFR